jgi:hypothetical protein
MFQRFSRMGFSLAAFDLCDADKSQKKTG